MTNVTPLDAWGDMHSTRPKLELFERGLGKTAKRRGGSL